MYFVHIFFNRTLLKDADGIEYRGEWSTCIPRTHVPTISPTTSPTHDPTPQPTLSPIQRLPWLFIGGDICEEDRCDCKASSLIKQKECCMLPTDDCDQYDRRYSSLQVSNGVSDNGRGDKPQYITINHIRLMISHIHHHFKLLDIIVSNILVTEMFQIVLIFLIMRIIQIKKIGNVNYSIGRYNTI